MSISSLSVWIPYTTAMTHITRQDYLRSLTIRVNDAVPSAVAEQGITKLLTQRHGTQDFSSMSIIGAFAVSSLIGVIFGFLPARNAARLDPIDALAPPNELSH